ncbi:hypothetical protein ACB092_11G066000 [Castanea dentata]
MTWRLCKLVTRCRSQRVVRDAVVYKKVRYVSYFVDLVSSEHPQMAVQFVITISFLVLLTYGLAEAAPISQPGCKTRCGKVSIPYPFGIGPGCYMDDWFQIVCNQTGAFLKKSNMEVLEISSNDAYWSNNEVRVKNSIISSDPSCPSKSSGGGMNIKESPFVFSEEMNTFISVGCNNLATIVGADPVVFGCKSHCNNSSMNGESNSCSGLKCCESTIPSGLQVSSVDFKNIDDNFTRSSGDDKNFPEGCKYAFLVEADWFSSHMNHSFAVEKIDFIPVVLDWKIYEWMNNSHEMLESFNNRQDFYCDFYINNRYIHTMDRFVPNLISNFSSFSCGCMPGYKGNPYLPTGCDDINECADPNLNSCPIKWDCQNTIGSYHCGKTKNIIIGISTCIGGLVLLITMWRLYKMKKKRNEIKLKKRFFKRNGGLLLQQQLSSSEHNIQHTKLFTSQGLEKATDQFNESRILGKGGQGMVYKGMLTDGSITAIKKCNIVDEGNLEQFINEIIILSHINHRNVVKLVGCCLETEIPLLVYEFIPNGTLSQYLHEESEEFPLTWDMRLRIAKEVAGALSYLHSAASLPIYHRDIKSTNILLDDKYRAKIADFGTSSFGVVLAELLTGEKPVSLVRLQESRSLATYFTLSMEEDFLFDILDARVKKEGDIQEIMVVAELTKRCLELNGKRRPTMREVTKELEGVRKSFNGQENCEKV